MTRQLAADAEDRRTTARLRSPWFSGLFYLMVACVAVALMLVAGRVAPWWAFPLVVLGAILLLAVVGALQMRQDDRLSERGFVRLMGSVFQRLPLLVMRRGAPSTDAASPKPETSA